MQKHEFEVSGFWGSSPYFGHVYEVLKCKHCGESKPGAEVDKNTPAAYGPFGDCTNKRDTCYTAEERAEMARVDAERRAAWEVQNAAESAARDTKLAAIVATGSISIEQARKIWHAGYSCGYESGADGGSFEQALGELDIDG